MECKETSGGLVISVRVKPNSGAFRLHPDGTLEIRSPPGEGKANAEIVKELSRLFGTDAVILRGRKSRRKLILLKDLRKGGLKD